MEDVKQQKPEDAAVVITVEDNPNKLESSDIANIIKGNSGSNVNVGNLESIIKEEVKLSDAAMDAIIEGKGVDEAIDVANNPNLQNTTQNTVTNTSDDKGIDAILASGNLDADTKSQIQKMIHDVQSIFAEEYAKKERELENKKLQEIERIRQEQENEKLSKMNEEEKKKYQEAMAAEAKELKLKFMTNRVEELETTLTNIENEKFISDKIAANPAIKKFVQKMQIKTKEDYATKIEPILDDIVRYVDYEKSNRNGNSNALRGYKSGSSVNKPVQSDEKYTNSFLSSIVMK